METEKPLPTSQGELLERVPFEFARDTLILPLERVQGESGKHWARCWAGASASQEALDNLSLWLRAPLTVERVPESLVRRAISEAYQERMERGDTLVQELAPSSRRARRRERTRVAQRPRPPGFGRKRARGPTC